VLNKVDPPAAEPDKVKQQIEDDRPERLDAILIAKTGLNVPEVSATHRLPPPATLRRRSRRSSSTAGTTHLGVVVLFRVVGRAEERPAHPHGHRRRHEVDRMACSRRRCRKRPSWAGRNRLSPPRSRRRYPRRRHHYRRQPGDAASRFRPAIRSCSAASFPSMLRIENRAAMGRLRLNDASFSYEMETRRRSASASAAASSGSSTSRSSRSGSARIQPQPDRDRAVGHLQDQADRRKTVDIHNPVDMPDVVKIREIDEP
jgi:GTP-binding protein LepA